LSSRQNHDASLAAGTIADKNLRHGGWSRCVETHIFQGFSLRFVVRQEKICVQ
jgi:hypothetical protein